VILCSWYAALCKFRKNVIDIVNNKSVIHALTAEGTKIKAKIDRHIEKMIATLKEKASHEKESLTKMLSDCKQQLVRTSSCMFQSADQHQSHLLTWGYISQRGILVTEQLTASTE
jgi:hypothetical protein